MQKPRNIYGDLRQRIGHINPVSRFLSRYSTIQVDKIVCLIGLKRSGLHAVANWLMGHESDALLVNNSPMKRLGLSSPMSRTCRSSPLPIRMYAGYPALSLDGSGKECATALVGRERLLIILFQSQSLAHLADHPLIHGVSARETHFILPLRDPFNWSASYKVKSREAIDSHHWPGLWREYANEYARISQYFPMATRLNYNRWLVDSSYRADIAASADLSANDTNLGVVTGHAGGSSFDAMAYQGRAMDMKLTSRWQSFTSDPSYLKTLQDNPDIVRQGLDLFDLPVDLIKFAKRQLVTGATSLLPGSGLPLTPSDG